MFSYREATYPEVEQLMQWAANEGWNPGLEDGAVFHAVDPHGFQLALDGDQPVAGVSVIRQGQTNAGQPFAFLGLYLCLPAYRGKGIGWQVWQNGMAYLGECVVGLDGVVAQQDNYRRSGFELAWRNVRYAGVPKFSPKLDSVNTDNSVTIRAFTHDDNAALVKLDAAITGVNRQQYISQWIFTSKHRFTLVLDQHTVAGSSEISGFGTIRRCQQGHKIGPLFVDDSRQAATLVKALCQKAQAESIMIDLPEPNAAAVNLALELGLEPVFETARMYKGPAPECDMARQFAVASFELG